MSIIRELRVPDSMRDTYNTGDAADRIENLSRLNVFIGPNNCGKSRFLRSIFSEEKLLGAPFGGAEDEIRALKKSLIDGIENLDRWPSQETLVGMIRSVYPPLRDLKTGSRNETRNVAQQQWETLANATSGGGLAWQLRHMQPNGSDLFSQWQRLVNAIKLSLRDETGRSELTRVYIPTLRGLRPFETTPHHYAARTIRDYFPNRDWSERESNGKVRLRDARVITGLELYEEIKRHLLGNLAERQLIAQYEKYLGRRFFAGQEVTLIPHHDGDALHVKIGNEAEKPIFHLGDGLQQLIILTIPLFIHRARKLMLFIEEPETYLHPAYQRAFIDLVLDPAEPGERQVFVATHSNHFLDITLDQSAVSVYKLAKALPKSNDAEQSPTFTITNTSNADFPLLAELGVRNSSVLLSNCTIWVEGITDRLYLRKYFEIFQKGKRPQYLEDVHFSFVEYGGANVTHWSFLDETGEGICVERLCGTLFLIADHDRGKEKRHELLRNTLGERYHQLPCREVENLITPAVLAASVKDQQGADLTLKSFMQEDYRDKYLGTFIEKHVLPNDWKPKPPKTSENPYAGSSGTIKDKVGFAQAVLARTNSIEDLSPEALRLCEEIYAFVQKHNP